MCLQWEITPTDNMFSKYREVFTSWEAFLGWKAVEVSYITHGHLKLKFTLCNDKELAV